MTKEKTHKNCDRKGYVYTALAYDFSYTKEYQPIYFGHIKGTTFTIAAKMTLVQILDKKPVIQAYFRCHNMGGKYDFKLDKITPKITKTGTVHDIRIQLKAKACAEKRPLETRLSFQDEFDPLYDKLRINIDNEQITGIDQLPPESISPSDDDRSCNIRVTNFPS